MHIWICSSLLRLNTSFRAIIREFISIHLVPGDGYLWRPVWDSRSAALFDYQLSACLITAPTFHGGAGIFGTVPEIASPRRVDPSSRPNLSRYGILSGRCSCLPVLPDTDRTSLPDHFRDARNVWLIYLPRHESEGIGPSENVVAYFCGPVSCQMQVPVFCDLELGGDLTSWRISHYRAFHGTAGGEAAPSGSWAPHEQRLFAHIST